MGTSGLSSDDRPSQPTEGNVSSYTPEPNAAALKAKPLPSLKRARRDLARAQEALTRLSSALDELWRRGSELTGADGYPSSSMGSGVQSTAELTSVEAAAEARVFAREVADPVLEGLAEIASNLAEMAGLAKIADRRRAYVLATHDAWRGNAPREGDCEACERFVSGVGDTRVLSAAGLETPTGPADRLRVGLCEACYRSWLRWRSVTQAKKGFAERSEFIAWRRAQIAESDSASPPRMGR